MSSQVLFADLRARNNESLPAKIGRLLKAAELERAIKKGGLAAVKIHFGERGNTAFVRPVLVRPVVDAVREAGGKPFLTDSGTLYAGSRGNAVDHLATAVLNGFAYPVVGAPLIVADGLDGRDEEAVAVNLKNTREAYVASAVARAASFVSVAHFKLHEVSGFGGAIKNTGMGGASRRGKMAQHSGMAPKVDAGKCVGCGVCRDQCLYGAIRLEERSPEAARPSDDASKIAVVNPELCVGCGGCLHACPQQAMSIVFEKDLRLFMERMVEYAVAALKGKERRCLFVNFLVQISPACDCHPFSDAPIVPDIGVTASTDPVAVDQASVDLLNAQCPLHSSCLENAAEASSDKIKAVYPRIPWEHQLEYAEELGLGSRAYELLQL